MNRRWLVSVSLLVSVGVSAVSGQVRPGGYSGRPLTEVLSELGRDGTPIVFSSRLVRPDMRVVAEPRARSTRRLLDEILQPHSLQIESGPKGQWLVVPLVVKPPEGARSGSPAADTGDVLVTFRLEGSRTEVPAESVALRSEAGSAGVRPDGRVLITGLPAGPHFLQASIAGYPRPVPATAVVRKGHTSDVRFDLASAPAEGADGTTEPLPPIDIIATRGLDHRETVDVITSADRVFEGPSAVSMPPAELMKGAGNGGNLLAPLHTLPGVKNGREFDSRLVVRGGAPDQNLVLIDGVEVLSPYHAFGLASTFLPEAVELVELSAGGFDARYGDRLSSVLSVRSRSGGDTRRLQGAGGAGLFDADLMLAGPLPGVSNASWMAAGRYTYVDLVAASVFDFGIPRFGDLHARISWEPQPGQRLSWLGLVGREASDYHETDDPGEDWTLHTRLPTALTAIGMEGTWRSRAMWRAVASVSDVRDTMAMSGLVSSDARGTADGSDPVARLAGVSFGRGAAVRDWALRHEWSIDSSSRQSWDIGGEAHWLQTRSHWEVAGDRNPGLANRSVPWPYGMPGTSLPALLDSEIDYGRTAAWIQHRGALTGRATLQAGLRFDRSDLARQATLSPRAALTLRLGNTTRLLASAGAYAQSPGYEKLLLSDYFLDLGATAGLRSERAFQTELGVEGEIAPGVQARVEIFRKSYTDLVVGRLETEDERRARLAHYDFGTLADSVPASAQITSVPSNGASGVAYGIDAQITRTPAVRDPRVTGWISYSYAVARRHAYGYTVPFDYDRRHAISAVAQFRLHPAVTLSGTVRFASAAPWTEPVGVQVAAREDRADADGDGDTAELIPARDTEGRLIYTHDLGGLPQINSARLPFYARVDARVTYQPNASRRRWSLYVDLINLLNRENPGLVSCRVGGASNGSVPTFVRQPDFSIPLLPSFGVRFRF
ncbi:MAG: TonB-dependent receptor [Acidobacteriota bacterium]